MNNNLIAVLILKLKMNETKNIFCIGRIDNKIAMTTNPDELISFMRNSDYIRDSFERSMILAEYLVEEIDPENRNSKIFVREYDIEKLGMILNEKWSFR